MEKTRIEMKIEKLNITLKTQNRKVYIFHKIEIKMDKNLWYIPLNTLNSTLEAI